MKTIINGLKQIKTRVDNGTITTVNGTETLLSKQLEELLKVAINYTHCCEELKDEEIPTFTDWLKDNGWKKTPSYYYYKKGGTTKERNLLIKMYQKEYYL